MIIQISSAGLGMRGGIRRAVMQSLAIPLYAPGLKCFCAVPRAISREM